MVSCEVSSVGILLSFCAAHCALVSEVLFCYFPFFSPSLPITLGEHSVSCFPPPSTHPSHILQQILSYFLEIFIRAILIISKNERKKL